MKFSLKFSKLYIINITGSPRTNRASGYTQPRQNSITTSSMIIDTDSGAGNYGVNLISFVFLIGIWCQWSNQMEYGSNGTRYTLHIAYTKTPCCLTGSLIVQSMQDLSASYISNTQYGFERYSGLSQSIRWFSLGY